MPEKQSQPHQSAWTIQAEDADYEPLVYCVVMPCCGFTFDASHTDDGGGPETYTCPQCAPASRLEVTDELVERAAKALFFDQFGLSAKWAAQYAAMKNGWKSAYVGWRYLHSGPYYTVLARYGMDENGADRVLHYTYWPIFPKVRAWLWARFARRWPVTPPIPKGRVA